MKKCPNCNNELNDDEMVCSCCGEILEQDVKPIRKMKPISDEEKETQSQSRPVKEAGKKKYTKKGSGKKKITYGSRKKSKLPVVIGIIVVVALAAALLCFFVFGKKQETGDKAAANTESESTVQESKDSAEETNISETEEQQGEDNSEVKSEANESDLAVLDYIINDASAATSPGEYSEALTKICEYAEKKDVGDYLTEKISDIYQNYKELVLASVNNLNSQEERPAIYLQMSMDLGGACDISERLVNSGVMINYDDLKSTRDSINAEYKQRLCNVFDNKAAETMSQNGVVSRSVLWDVMERGDETGLFDPEDKNDPLNVRYMTALALKTDSEIESLDMAQAVLKLYQMLEPTDYSPILIYYLARNYGDTQAQEWLDYIDTVIGGFSSYDIGTMRNYMITYMGETEKRDMIREYMWSHYNAN